MGAQYAPGTRASGVLQCGGVLKQLPGKQPGIIGIHRGLSMHRSRLRSILYATAMMVVVAAALTSAVLLTRAGRHPQRSSSGDLGLGCGIQFRLARPKSDNPNLLSECWLNLPRRWVAVASCVRRAS